MKSRQVGLLCGAALGGIATLLYWAAMRGGFVWDDYVLADGSAIGGGSLGACFTTAFLDHYYRPLVSFSFFLDRLWWPNDAAAYHRVGVILHACSTVAVMGLLRSAYRRWSIAVAGALLFGVHPAHVGAVAWIGGRTDALGVFWTALFAWGLIEAATNMGDRRSLALAGSVVAYGLAVFTKEQSLALLPLVPAAFVAFKPRRGVNLPGTPWFALGPFAVVAAFYLALGVFLGMPKLPPIMTPLWEHAIRVGQIAAGYGELLLWPTQTILHTYSLARLGEAMPWSAIAGFGLIGATVGGLLWLWRTDRVSAWFLTLAALALAPVSGVIPMPFLLFAPYRAAVAVIGIAPVLARWVLQWQMRTATMTRLPAMMAVSVLAFWFTVQTLTATRSWETEDTFFQTMVHYDPGAAVGRLMLARMAVERGDDAEAEHQLAAILSWLYGQDRGRWNWQDPKQAHEALRRSWRVRAQVMQDRGAVGEAEDYVTMLFVQLGYARLRQNNLSGASTAFATALGWRPNEPSALTGLAWCELSSGRYVEAERHLRTALEADPQMADARRLLGYALEYQGRYAEAQEQWRLLQ
ncbi:MAG: tetratricopeptide repeat protein [Chthonomonadales bacterium]|nr:tetratricopeptide repeat protein [Chthonomonadales bacterium]